MSLESDLRTLLGPFVSNRVYPDVTPDDPQLPLIVYQQVGGDVVEFLEGEVGDKDHARMRIHVWAKTRLQATAIARQVRLAIVRGPLKGTTYGAAVSLHEDMLKNYGNRTDYGIWYTPDP
jgi:hypothetical protein